MTTQAAALKAFLETTDTAKVTTLYYPAFNPWGGNQEYFKAHGINYITDLTADPMRYGIDLGYHWGVFKVIRGVALGEYLGLLSAALAAEPNVD